MIDIETLTRLKTMRLSGMAEYFENLADTTGTGALTGPEMVKQAVDSEYERRRNSKLHRLRRQAGFAQPDADIADIKAMPGRAVNTELIARLRLSRVSWNLSGGPPPDTARGVGVGRPLKHHQEGDHHDQQVPEEHVQDEYRARARRARWRDHIDG